MSFFQFPIVIPTSIKDIFIFHGISIYLRDFSDFISDFLHEKSEIDNGFRFLRPFQFNGRQFSIILVLIGHFQGN